MSSAWGVWRGAERGKPHHTGGSTKYFRETVSPEGGEERSKQTQEVGVAWMSDETDILRFSRDSFFKDSIP